MATSLQNQDIQLHVPRSKFPWEVWFDGQLWELVPGEDFEVSVKNFRATIYYAASIRNLKVSTTVVDGKIHLQSFGPKDA